MKLKDANQSDNAFVNLLIPQKGDSKNVLIRKYAILAITLLVIIAIIVSCSYVAAMNHKEVTANASNQSTQVTSIDTQSSKPIESSSQNISSETSSASSVAPSSKPTSSQKQNTTSKTNTIKKPNKTKPTTPATCPENYLDEFKTWFKTNRDVKGRLVIPNTNVNYPVAQGSNNSYYLNHNEYKASSGWGVPFMDYRANVAPGSESTNITIYGHSDDKRGLQLSGVKKYKDLSFYQQNPVIQFDSAYERSEWKVLGFFLEDVSSKNPIGAFQYHNFVYAQSEGEFNNFVAAVRTRSFYDTPVDAVFGDRFLTISTCYSLSSQDFRYVMVARKVRAEESASVDSGSATLNADRLVPKRPIQ